MLMMLSAISGAISWFVNREEPRVDRKTSEADTLSHLKDEAEMLCLIERAEGLTLNDIRKIASKHVPSGFVFVGELPAFVPAMRHQGFSVYLVPEVPVDVVIGIRVERTSDDVHAPYDVINLYRRAGAA
ncbi:hypothetical protein ACYPKM_03390 [Pseudomonas aeruginosa]